MAYDCYSIPADSAKLAVDDGEGTGKVRFVVGKMATQWKNFEKAMKERRTCKRKSPSHEKYSRISPRELVPFDYEEVTLDNIKNACRRHFDRLA